MTICKCFLCSSESTLSITYSALSQAINEMLAIVDTKMAGIVESTNRVEQVMGRVETDIVDIHVKVVHINDHVSQIQSEGKKAQTGAYLLFSSTICH